MPLSPFGKNGEDVSGSIAKSNPLSRALDSEDWRRAKAALGRRTPNLHSAREVIELLLNARFGRSATLADRRLPCH